MATAETSDLCSDHPDRPSVGKCGRCGRTLCIECAIPFRGSLRCETCTALELGEPAPPPAPRRRRIGLPWLALAATAVAVIATTVPWHRSGTLTGAFSTWLPGLDPWATAAAIASTLALVCFGLALRFRRARRWSTIGAVLALVAAVATILSVLRSPDFFSATPAPLVTLVASAVAALVGGLVSRRHRA